MKVLFAKDVMTRDVMTVSEDWSVERLSEFFLENSISGAPVISEDGNFLGVVSATDIVKNDVLQKKETATHEPHEYYLRCLEDRYAGAEIASLNITTEPVTTVADIMTRSVFDVPEETPIQKVATIMIKNRIHRIFVTKEDKILGVISSADMLKIIRDM